MKIWANSNTAFIFPNIIYSYLPLQLWEKVHTADIAPLLHSHPP